MDFAAVLRHPQALSPRLALRPEAPQWDGQFQTDRWAATQRAPGPIEASRLIVKLKRRGQVVSWHGFLVCARRNSRLSIPNRFGALLEGVDISRQRVDLIRRAVPFGVGQ